MRNACCKYAIGVAIAGATLSASEQDFVVQPPPMAILSSPAAPRTQSFDQPLPGALSPRNASYDIDVRLDHGSRSLKGRETLRWRNISRQDAQELPFHLYWNAWRNEDSTWMRERRLAGNRAVPRTDAWSRIDVTAIRLRDAGGFVDLMPHLRYVAPDDENPADRTVMTVTLPRAVGPNDTIEVEIEWTARVPRPFARTGYVGDYYFFGQWFPKIGVLEDGGWNAHQFHNRTEFYADFGVYDVRMTVPRGWTVGASGRETSRTDNADGTTTHRYRGEDIIDFAWTTSPDFVEHRQTFTHATLPPVEMRLLLRPDHAGQGPRHFAATAAALRYYGEWYGAYPYGYLTIVDPAFQSESDGMEYPTLFTAGTSWLAPGQIADPESVTIHEAGHQWWYAIVATNEFEHAWMDEGLNQYSDPHVLEVAGFPNHPSRRYFGGFVPWVFRGVQLTRSEGAGGLSRFQSAAKADAQTTPTFRYWPTSATAITYFKTSLWLETLERLLGWPTTQKILATYFERWRFRHPKPDDFFRVANEVSGQDLTWFFDQVYRSSNAFDYRVQHFSSVPSGGGHRTVVVVERRGEAVFPIEVVTTFRDGQRVTEHWNGRERRRMYVYTRASDARVVEVDPGHLLLLDVNYTNNSETLEPRAGEASLKWALTWMVWLQDLMLTYGFFA